MGPHAHSAGFAALFGGKPCTVTGASGPRLLRFAGPAPGGLRARPPAALHLPAVLWRRLV